MSPIKLATVVLIAALQVASCETSDRYPPPEAGPVADQGWDHATTQSWYHMDQGTAFFPYAWLIALEQAEGQERFIAPGNMERFGFLSNPPSAEFNPDGLPVGFSRTSLDLGRPPFSCWPGEWAGLTCAACHTGEIRYHGKSIRIEGGPAQNDIEGFRVSLAQALAATTADPAKTQRFVGRVLQAAGNPSRDVPAALRCIGQAGAARERIVREGLANASEPPTDSGFGRLDALGRGGNFLFAESTGTPVNYEPTTAPVSYPALWTRRTSTGFSTTTRCASRSRAASSRRSASVRRST